MFDTSVLEFIRDGGLVVGVLVLVFLLITGRIPTPGQLQSEKERRLEERDRRIDAEKVRDEALAGWTGQAAATKELADLWNKPK